MTSDDENNTSIRKSIRILNHIPSEVINLSPNDDVEMATAQSTHLLKNYNAYQEEINFVFFIKNHNLKLFATKNEIRDCGINYVMIAFCNSLSPVGSTNEK